MADDPRVERYAAERAELSQKVHKKVNSSRQRGTVPFLVGDSDRAVAAVVESGWIPTPNEEDKQRAVETAKRDLHFFCVKRGDAELIVETVLRGLGLI